MKKFITFFIILFLICGISCICFFKGNPAVVSWFQTKVIKKYTIVIDPGHGGFDPGKVGINQALEKDINLKISLYLKDLLEKQNCTVILTRSNDIGLYEENDSNKKRSDMKKRVDIINESNANLAISIHQNSFQEQSSKGAQVFYHNQSQEGKQLAEVIQAKLKENIDDGNHRMAKSNDSYYMLKNTTCPLVIVECGFLSNQTEADKLITSEYQEQIAQAILEGILSYLNAKQ